MISDLLIEGVIIEFLDHNPCRRAIVRRVQRDTVALADISNGRIHQLSIDSLETQFSMGGARFLSESKDHGDLTFVDLSVEDQRETNRRYKYVKKLQELQITKVTEKNVANSINDIAAELDESPPHWQTLRRWYGQYIDSGEKLRGLFPKHFNKGRRQSRLDPRVSAIIKQESKRYFKGSSPSVASIARNVEAKILAHNLNHPEDCLQIPTYPTIKTRLDDFSYEKKQKTRSGKQNFQSEMSDAESGIETDRILERVEIDHTQLDLHVLHDEHGTLSGRPYITVLIDHYSHMVLGLQLSFEPPSFASVSMACKNAFLKKDKYLLDLECEVDWPAHGIPSSIVTDNANEFWGKDFKKTADELGPSFQYCPIRSGNYKSRVERFFGILNTVGLDDLPGVVRKPGKCSSDYDARQHASMTFSEAKRYIVKWICNVFHNLPISSSGMTPNELWSESEEEFPIPEEDEMELLPILMASDTRTLNNGRINKFTLSYNSSILKDLYRREGPIQVQIKYDPFDIGYILVLDKRNKVYIKVNCERYAYASGLSKFEHDKIRRRAKQKAKDRFENPDLQRAKVELAQERDELHQRNKRRKVQVTTAKAARSEKVGFDNFKVVIDNSENVVQLNRSHENDNLDMDGWDID